MNPHEVMQAIEALTAEEYQTALTLLRGRMARTDLRLLEVHYHTPHYVTTATQLAFAVGFANFNAVNLRYGQLGGRFCEYFNLWPPFKVEILVIFEKPGREWLWIMRPALVQAIGELGWFSEEQGY